MVTALLVLLQAAATPAPAPTQATPAPAATPASPEQADERCLAAFSDLASRPGTDGAAGRYGLFFFYGRLLGRNPALDLSAALPAAARAIGDGKAELARCGRELSAAGQGLAAIGSGAAAR